MELAVFLVLVGIEALVDFLDFVGIQALVDFLDIVVNQAILASVVGRVLVDILE